MHGQSIARRRTVRVERRLRTQPTEAERALWRILRRRQFDGCKFRRQHPFGDFVLDFVCLERRLVVEVDGGQHATATVRDAVRTRALESAGFTVLRFWNNDVLVNGDSVGERIWQELTKARAPSPPQPSP